MSAALIHSSDWPALIQSAWFNRLGSESHATGCAEGRKDCSGDRCDDLNDPLKGFLLSHNNLLPLLLTS